MRQLKALALRIGGVAMVGAVRATFALARALGRERARAVGSWLTRTLGPLTPQHRIAAGNLAAAFPTMSEAERRKTLLEAWDNLGRTAAEYAELAELIVYDADNPDPNGPIEIVGAEHFATLREDGKPGIIFSAHLANWELPAIAARQFGLDATAVFRPPNDPAVAAAIHEVRAGAMGGLAASRRGAAFAMQAVIEEGGHLGMLIDQHFTRGVVVDFLGRPALANPVLAKFARRFECPVHGVRVVRLEGGRFRLELTPPLDLPRDHEGLIDVAAATQAMTDVIAGWVRENPGQWLWMHRRWRPNLVEQAMARKSASTHFSS